MKEDFYNSDLAQQMAEEYRKQSARTPSADILDLLADVDALEKTAESLHILFARRRKIRLLLKCQRKLLAILLLLSPDDATLGETVYNRLLSLVDRLEKLC